MTPADLSPVANHLWQSTLFVGAAGLLTLALRKNHARVRHWVWLAASCKFLIPLSVLIALGGHIQWRPAPEIAQPKLLIVMDEVSQPFTASAATPLLVTSPPAASPLPVVLWGIWSCGVFGIACAWWIRWRRIRAVVRAGSPLPLALPIKAMSSPALLEPGIFGVFRPVLLLPEGIFDRLTPAQLEAVIAHELCHVRHRDNLISVFHMFVETVFWFHPLVWWIGKRMVEERERACDEEVLRLGSEPRVYAEGILNVCKLYVESPLACVSGVTGSNLKKRIEAIMSNRVAARLSPAKKVFLAVAGTAGLAAPIVVGIMNAPPIRAQAANGATPKFEVASIKPCDSGSLLPGARSGKINVSPGRLSLNCVSVYSLIARAYVDYANGQYQGAASSKRLPMEKWPAWSNSEHYTVEAVTKGTVSRELMQGPMLQALLEDRFKLKTHRETREVPIYEMTVAKSGLKLQRAEEGSCVPRDPAKLQLRPDPGQKPFCGQAALRRNGPNWTVELRSMTLDEFSHWLDVSLDRLVVDRTGVSGKFDINMEYSHDQDLDAPDAGPSIPDALQKQLGLKLAPAKRPGDFLVIDHVEKPSEN